MVQQVFMIGLPDLDDFESAFLQHGSSDRWPELDIQEISTGGIGPE